MMLASRHNQNPAYRTARYTLQNSAISNCDKTGAVYTLTGKNITNYFDPVAADSRSRRCAVIPGDSDKDNFPHRTIFKFVTQLTDDLCGGQRQLIVIIAEIDLGGLVNADVVAHHDCWCCVAHV